MTNTINWFSIGQTRSRYKKKKWIYMYTALQVMNWLREYSYQDYKSDPNIDCMTPMRVQKLLYYAQCTSLALNS